MQNESIAAVQKFPLSFGVTEVTNKPSNCGVHKSGNETGYKRSHT
jgi:hypothetical protein